MTEEQQKALKAISKFMEDQLAINKIHHELFILLKKNINMIMWVLIFIGVGAAILAIERLIK